MGIVIGIDVGISTTKIVGIKNNKVSAPIRITAADPITSLYGAFGISTSLSMVCQQASRRSLSPMVSEHVSSQR